MKVKIKKNTAYDRLQKHRDNTRVVARLECADPKRRKKLEKDPLKWLKYYFPDAFDLDFGQVHQDIADTTINAVIKGSDYAIAGPRGTGKTTEMVGLAIYCKFVMGVNFIVYIPWSVRDQNRALSFWKNALCFNQRLIEDYPEYCQPFAYCKGASQKLSFLKWADNGEPCEAKLSKAEGKIVFPDGLGILGSSSMGGNPRGMNHSTMSGKILRPDFALIDDPQSLDMIKSEYQVKKAIELIEKDIAGMAGPGKQITKVIICTVQSKNDVTSYFLNHDEWSSYKVGQIETWSKNMDLWDEFNMVRMEFANISAPELISDEVLKFYFDNKEKLNEGLKITWEARYDKKRGQPDAKFSAMWDYYTMGKEAFMSERQNEPLMEDTGLYELNEKTVLSRVNQFKRFVVPEWADFITVGTDINHYGLHTVVTAFKTDQSAAIIHYFVIDNQGKGIVPKNASDLDKRQRIFRALQETGEHLRSCVFMKNNQQKKIDGWLIDGGYELQTVQSYVNGEGAKLGIPLQVVRGYAATRYRPTPSNCVGKPREMCHLAESSFGRWIAANVDYWREISQRAWLGGIGSPGAISLFEGIHFDFAEQICREKLSEKIQSKSGIMWMWRTQPGRHDYGDSLVYCYVAAAWCGVSAGSGFNTVVRNIKQGSKRVSVKGINY